MLYNWTAQEPELTTLLMAGLQYGKNGLHSRGFGLFKVPAPDTDPYNDQLHGIVSDFETT
jgi:hypothetical protein